MTVKWAGGSRFDSQKGEMFLLIDRVLAEAGPSVLLPSECATVPEGGGIFFSEGKPATT
jgi:hypothetical protein